MFGFEIWLFNYLPVTRFFKNTFENSCNVIQKGFQNLKPGADYDNLSHAAKCRSEADWLVGLNATRAFTMKHGTLLSVGRVQTPTLALLVQREAGIDGFTPRDFWEVYAYYQENFTGKWWGKTEQANRTYDQSKAEKVKNKVVGKTTPTAIYPSSLGG